MWRWIAALTILTLLLAACSAGTSDKIVVTQVPPTSPAGERGNSSSRAATSTVTSLAPLPAPTATPEGPAAIPFALGGGSIVETVEVPAGPFIMGSDNADSDEAPRHAVKLPTFYIDRYEVTNSQFRAFVEATGYQTDAEKAGQAAQADQKSQKSWKDYAQGKDDHPVVKVSWNDALAFCKWMGKRLPTEEEWEKTARGSDERIYPWGDKFDASRANVKLTGLRGTAAVGSFPTGASPYGAQDMAGNVGEWTASPYLGYPGSTYQDPSYSEEFKVTRGGGWLDDEQRARTTSRNAADPLTANEVIGFRCAQ
jgi:iron(II)-dependent oxidoreductase